jgi:hypothetical protein
MNQKEQIEKAKEVCGLFDPLPGTSQYIVKGYIESLESLSTPQSEASDREIARSLVKEIVAIVKPQDITPLFSKDIDSACEHILKHDATIRADERRKVEDDCLAKLKDPSGVYVMILRGDINASSYKRKVELLAIDRIIDYIGDESSCASTFDGIRKAGTGEATP